MATYDELMAGLRAAHAAGDTEAAREFARRARAAQTPAPAAVTLPPDAATPAAPDQPGLASPMSQIAALMIPAPPAAAASPTSPRPPQNPRLAATVPVAPVASAAAPPSPGPAFEVVGRSNPGSLMDMATIAAMMAGQGQPVAAPATRPVLYDPGPLPGPAGMQAPRPGAPVPPLAADPFADEGLGALAARRGQQFAVGAGEVVASVPEALAIMGARADETRRAGAEAFGIQRAETIAAIKARLADPTLDAATRAFLTRNLADMTAGQQVVAAEAAAPVTPAGARPMFARGDQIRDALQSAVGTPDPRDTGFWSQVAGGAGNMAGMIGASLVGGVAGGPAGALATGAASGASLNAPSIYKEAIEAGADEQTARDAATWGALIGASEILPITRALRILPPRLRGELTTGMMRRFVDIAQGAGEEAAQEYLATVANNIVAERLYDPERGWTEGATDAALVGAVLGAGVGAVGSAIEGRGATRPPREREEPAAPQAPAQDAAPAPPTPETASPATSPVDAKARAVASLEAFAKATKGAAIPADSPAARQFDALLAAGERAGLTSDEIDAALSGRPQPSAPQQIQTAAITRAEAEADPGRYEIIGQSEGTGSDWQDTGAEAVLDKATGQVHPLAPEQVESADAEQQAQTAASGAASDPSTGAVGGTQPMGGSGAVEPGVEGRDSAGIEPAGPGNAQTDPVPEGAGKPDQALTGTRPANAPQNFEFLNALDVQRIGTEPGVMQYKAGGDAEGVTDRLKGVTEWRPERAGVSVIYEYADGRRVIADGHQRLGLAKRLAAEGKPIQMPVMVLRQVDGITPEDARVTAALKNIAEGSGTALDAAKVLRGSTQTVQDMALPPGSAIVRDAMGMRDLSDAAFGMVVNGVASERDGGIVGRVVTDRAAQANILGLLARMQKDRPITAFQAEQVARQAAADTVTETQDSLFGPESDTKNLYLERAKILEAASRMKREELRAFKNVVENADRLEAAGNQLDANANQSAVDSAARLRDYLSREANTKGPISDALTEAARALNGGASVADATRQFLAAAERVASGGLVQGQPAQGGSARPGGDQGSGAPDQQRDPEPGKQAPVDTGADLFAPPQTGKSPAQVKAEAEAAVRAQQSKIRKAGGNSGDAGPLFDDQGDLLAQKQPATSDPRAALLAARDKALAPYTKPDDAKFDAERGSTSLFGTEAGNELLDDLAAAKTLDAKRKAAEAWVLKQGKATAQEHLVVLDKDGTPLSIDRGRKDAVSPEAAVWRAGNDGAVWLSVHNHPQSSGLSGGDLSMLSIWPGHTMVVLGHNGDRHQVTGKAGFDRAGDYRGAEKDTEWFANTRDAIADARSIAYQRLNAILLERGEANDAGFERWKAATAPLFQLVLDDLGLIAYDDRAEWLARFEAQGFNYGEVYGQVSGPIADRLGRAGFVVSAGRDRSGDRAAGGDAKAPSPGADGKDRKPAKDAGGEHKRGAPVTTGNADLDGALDDIFGGGGNVSGTGNDLERGGGDGAAGDGVGGTDVPAPAGRDDGRGERRTGKGDGGNRKPRAGRRVSGGDAAVPGAGGDQAADGSVRANRQPAAGGNRGGRDGDRDGGLSADARGKDAAAGDASGEPRRKLTPAERLAAIRDAMKEDVAEWAATRADRSTDSPAFKRWFGDSKVVDAQGRPLVVYHGTAADFEAFDLSRKGSHFGTSAQASWRVDAGNGQRIVPAYLSIQNPKRIRDTTGWTSKVAQAKAEGYDGIIYLNRVEGVDTASMSRFSSTKLMNMSDSEFQRRFGGEDSYIAFSPTQIKSVFNRGTWDGSDPRMLAEDAIDPARYDQLSAIFADAVDGVNVAQATDRQLFGHVILPLVDLGMTRDEVAALRPYLERFISDLKAGRVNKEPGPETALDRLNAVVPGWSGANGMLTNPDPARGGIIDRRIADKKWFVILNGSTRSADGLDTVDQAADWFIANFDKATQPKPAPRVVFNDRENIDQTLPLLLPEQRDDVAKIEARFVKPNGHGMLITNGTGTGKAQPLDAGILTPTGWRRMGDLAPGDKVIAADGSATEVLAVYPQGMKPIYRVEFSDGAATECCDEHLWETQTLYERRKGSANPAWNCAAPKVRSLAEIRASLDAQHFLPVVAPIEHPARNLPVRPYTLGVILGDGCLRGGAIIIANPDEQIAAEVATEVGTGFQVAYTRERRCPTWRISDDMQQRGADGWLPRHRMIQPLRDMGLMGALSADKFIPDDYLTSSVDDRLHLLQGLMDTDGTVDRRTGSVSFCSVSRRLAEGVITLVRSLGGIATTTTSRKFFTHNGERREGQLAYVVTLHLPNDMPPFRLSRKAALVRQKLHAPRRKIVSVSLVGEKPAQCIAVADPRHLYVTDDYVLTHNTYSGMGQIKRFVQAGKKNILIVAPSEAVIAGWVSTGEALGVPVYQLRDTKDAGQGVTVTTYANFAANDALASRDFDLIVPDEAQNLMSNAAGEPTGNIEALRAISMHPMGLGRRWDMQHAEDWARQKAMPEGDAKKAAWNRLWDRRTADAQKWATQPRTKVLFLSATPWAYDKTVDYTEGYLFDYPEDQRIGNSNQTGRAAFFVRNFGYRIRYHKLTKPEHAVDSAVFEREFHEKLRREGVLSGRSLQIDVDYDRRFVRKDDAEGSRLDEALEALEALVFDERQGRMEKMKAAGPGNRIAEPFSALQDHMRKNFDYLERQKLLEAIKARMAVPEIEKHLALGRKVVVFHDFNVGGGFNPFTHLKTKTVVINPETGESADVPVSPMSAEAADGYRQLVGLHPWIAKLNFAGYKAPIKALPDALGKRARLFNGTIPTKQRLQNLADFNTDGSGADVLIVQADAGGAGISMHDTTGKHQRVLINLGMPTKPTTTLQQEGRILRVGTRTNAPFRYFTIGTGWERTAFAQRIAERSGTVENLALGNEARDLMNAFIDAYMDAADFAPSSQDGIGGKAKDSRAITITPYERAKTHYFGRPKVTGRRDQREGVDFYATPEPLGLKMVEWAGIRANERVLEPSAGDGAIARYMPDDAAVTLVEPSSSLGSAAQLRTPKANLIGSTFENYHLVNKHHVIVMNPPFGSGGATAVAHLAKAARHLRPGGRIVALIPTGPAADKRFDAWWGGDDAKGLNLSAEVALPAVAFERAGTGVMTRIVVIDKPADGQKVAPDTQRINFTGARTINDFFDRLEQYEVRARPAPVADILDELAAEGEDATTPPRAMRPGPALAGEVDAFERTAVTAKSGKVFPAAAHKARVTRELYDQLKEVAQRFGGWWHKVKDAPRDAGPTFAFRTETGRERFIEATGKQTMGMEEDAQVEGLAFATSLGNIMSKVPELARARYDFQTGTFRSSQGEPISDGMLDGWASSHPRVREASAGRDTLKRGILLNTLARTEGGQRPGLLEYALRIPGKLVAKGLKDTFYQVPDRQELTREAAASTEEIRRLMPVLRAELDRLDLKRVRLSQNDGSEGWQGAFVATGDGEMEIIIGASLDPVKTLHHEVIHALRAMNLFTPEEWRALSIAAERSWLKKHDIAERYPHLSPDERIEEAIAEEFTDALAARRSPSGSALVTAFNKIARILKAFRNIFLGAGFQTPEDIFGRVLAGEISKRQAGNTGAAARAGFAEQRPPLAVRPLTPHGRAVRNNAMGAMPFVPDRRVWETLTRAGIPIWQRLRDLPGAASDAVDRARFVIQDRFLPVLRAQEAVMLQAGRPLPPQMDAYTAETTFSGKVGRHLLDVDEQFTKPIIQIMAASRGRMDVETVGEWLYARHAKERNAYIASINPNMPDGGSGMTDAEAQSILAAVAASPDAAAYDRIGQLVDGMRNWSIDLRRDAGLISDAEAVIWRNQYAHYVPLRGWEETDHQESVLSMMPPRIGRRFSIRGAETQRALGRESEAFNPLQSAITMAQEVAIRAEKNRVAQAIHALAVANPSDALWKVKTPKQKRYFNRTTGLVETRIEQPVTSVMGPNEMAVKIDGKEHRILFMDERIAKAAGTLGPDQMGAVMRVLSVMSRFFSMTRTMLNPEFMITNAFRDFQTAQFNVQGLDQVDKGKIAKAMAKNWRKAFLGVMRGQTYRFDTEWSRYFDEFQKAGAQVWFWTMENPTAAREHLARRVDLARGSKARRALRAMTSPAALLSFRDNPALAYIERVNMAVDNAIRLAAFVEARRQGMPVEKAAFLAKELTVNFNRRGEAGPQMNALYPFFNAAVQGTVRTAKALSSRRVAGMVLTAFAAGLLLDLVNAALSDRDEDDELFYDKVPDYRSERNLHLVIWGKGDTPLAIPMPYGFNVFPYAGGQLGKVLRGVKGADEALADVAAAAFGAFSPISASTPAQMASPFIADPLVEMAENKDWLGGPIYPRDFGNQTEPDSHVHFSGATQASRWVAQTINAITGGDFRESGMIDVSPETLDHLSKFVVGSAGAFWGRSADTLTKALTGNFDQIEGRDVPFLRNLTSPIGEWTDRDRYYRFGAEVKNGAADKKAYEAAGVAVPSRTAALASLYDAWLAAERERNQKGAWNPAKAGTVAARAQGKVFLDFNRKYISVMGHQGE